MKNNFIKDYWLQLEKKHPLPKRCRNVVELDFNKLQREIEQNNETFLKKMMNSIIKGDFYILKNSFTEKFINDLKVNTFNYFKSKNDEFHKMIEGTPDFHRKINFDIGKKYSIHSCKHSFYYFPWNKDPNNIFPEINSKWRVIKKIMGLKFDEYENNTPKDGVVDRIQVVQYPSKIGYLEPHTDPYQNQRFFISGYMSKQGKDFDGLGFYLIDDSNNVVEVEHRIDVGDLGIGYATVYHGVAPVNKHKDPDWSNINDGSWFLGLYSNSSDLQKNRVTSSQIKEKFDDDRLYP